MYLMCGPHMLNKICVRLARVSRSQSNSAIIVHLAAPFAHEGNRPLLRSKILTINRLSRETGFLPKCP